jgi:hypothetical protein
MNTIIRLGLLFFLLILPVVSFAQEGEGDSSFNEEAVIIEEDEEASLKRKAYSIGGRLNGWLADLEAKATIDSGSIPGTEVDFESDLDFDKTIAIASGEFFITTRFFSIYVDYFGFEDSSTTILNTTLTFEGITFMAGFPVESKLDLDSLSAKIVITPLATENAELGVVVGARYFRVFGEISTQAPIALSASDSFEAPIPFVGLSGRAFIDIVELSDGFTISIELFGYIQGLNLDYQPAGSDTRYKASYLEYEGGAALNIGDNIAIFVSYRSISVTIDEEEDETGPALPGNENEYELFLGGPSFGVRLRF